MTTGLVVALMLPGTEYFGTERTYASESDVEQYEKRFNTTEIMDRFKPNPVWDNLGLIGQIVGTAEVMFKIVGFMLDGFPTLLTSIKESYITSAVGRTAFDAIASVLRVVFVVMMAFFVIEFISGRRMPD